MEFSAAKMSDILINLIFFKSPTNCFKEWQMSSGSGLHKTPALWWAGWDRREGGWVGSFTASSAWLRDYKSFLLWEECSLLRSTCGFIIVT
jgi:hypothetical protein